MNDLRRREFLGGALKRAIDHAFMVEQDNRVPDCVQSARNMRSLLKRLSH